MGDLVQKYIRGTTAVKISQEIEEAVRSGRLLPGDRLPPVRELAGELGISPTTVASAYQSLQSRAVLVAHKRRGTRVSHRPLAGSPAGLGGRAAGVPGGPGGSGRRRRQVMPKGAIDLSDGNPDPALLPSFDRILRELKYKPRLYGEEPMHAGLIDLMRREMKADGVDVHQCAVVSGAMEGLDRLFAEHLRAGDRVAVEDPGFTGHHDLIASRGLTLVPVRIDAEGMLPDALERACREGVKAVLITPRAQSPTGAALTAQRARELRRALRRAPEALVIEDDHASFLCAESVPCECVHDRAGRWAHIRSLSKSFNPDLRLAVMTGDDQTMNAVLDRIVVAERWVSHMLQATAHALLSDKTVRAQVREAGRTYDQRRDTLIALLEDAGLQPTGRSGYNVWLPVQEETPTVQGLAAAAGGGFAVAAGERFRLASPPGIRITASRLEAKDAKSFTDALMDTLSRSAQRPAM
jgi:DNA-binding transcriptional MocR family regulator